MSILEIETQYGNTNTTSRGKLQKDVDPLKTDSIKRMSIMMRRYNETQHYCRFPNRTRLTFDSFFGSQKGDFSLTIKSITALEAAPAAEPYSQIASQRIPKMLDAKALEDGTLRSQPPTDPRQASRARLWFETVRTPPDWQDFMYICTDKARSAHP
jgi:hypothetical protein